MRVVEYTLINEQPIKIANVFLSKSGETETIYYITGSALRGVITNSLVKNPKFDYIKRNIFSEKVSFLNAYPMYKNLPLIPSPKGFYENKKQDGKLQNVVKDGKFDAGMKRAKLGQFCYIQDNNKICYMSVDSEQMLNIDVKNQNIYRNNYISAGYTFKGYIIFDDAVDIDIISIIKEVLQSSCIRIGSERTLGFGKVKIKDIKESEEIPFSQYSISSNFSNQKNYVYMMLLSPMSMRGEFGEPIGINERELGRLLDVNSLKVEMASTSVIKKRGFNRVWKTATDEYLFYEQGSVFKLSYDGVINSDNLKKIEEIGLGIGRNEGNGRVIFLKDYENLNYKKEIDKIEFEQQNTILDTYKVSDSDKENVMNIVSESFKRMIINRKMDEYITNPKHRIDKTYASNSQAGEVLSRCRSLRYDLDHAESQMNEFFGHVDYKVKNKKKHSTSKTSQAKMAEKFKEIMDTDINKLFNISNNNGYSIKFDKKEQVYYKLMLIEQMITFANRASKVE